MSRHKDQNIPPDDWYQDWEEQSSAENRKSPALALGQDAWAIRVEGAVCSVYTSTNGVDIRQTEIDCSHLDDGWQPLVGAIRTMLADVRERTFLDAATAMYREAQATAAGE